MRISELDSIRNSSWRRERGGETCHSECCWLGVKDHRNEERATNTGPVVKKICEALFIEKKVLFRQVSCCDARSSWEIVLHVLPQEGVNDHYWRAGLDARRGMIRASSNWNSFSTLFSCPAGSSVCVDLEPFETVPQAGPSEYPTSRERNCNFISIL